MEIHPLFIQYSGKLQHYARAAPGIDITFWLFIYRVGTLLSTGDFTIISGILPIYPKLLTVYDRCDKNPWAIFRIDDGVKEVFQVPSVGWKRL